MAEIRDNLTKKDFVRYLKSLGIEIHLNTKARGHNGFCTNKRIDVSRDLSDEKAMNVLFHEFGHYIHFKLEPEIVKSHGSLRILFNIDDFSIIEKELYSLTISIFDDSVIKKIEKIKKSVIEKIKIQRKIIKENYPDFRAVKKFKEFDKYIRYNDAKYLLKYDKVIIKGGWFSKNRVISINTIEEDFPKMPREFAAYIRMKSYERRRNRLNARMSRVNRYLKRPTELFARFFEVYCTDKEILKSVAPNTLKRFEELKKKNYYPLLNEFCIFAGN